MLRHMVERDLQLPYEWEKITPKFYDKNIYFIISIYSSSRSSNLAQVFIK